MFYDLSTPIGLMSAIKRFEFLVANKKRINLTEKRKKRSHSQNRYLHLILGWFALQTGYTVEESKHLYKMQSKDLFVYEKKGTKFVRSSADLNTKEMSIVIERFRNYSAEAGIYLPEANEVDFLNHIERNLEKYENKIYI